MRTAIVYNRNPLMCSIYAQYVLGHCPELWAAILISSPVDLFRLKEKTLEGTLVCVIFDVDDWPLVDMEVGGKMLISLVVNPADPSEIRAALRKLGIVKEV